MRGEPLCAPQCGGRCAPPTPSNFLLDARGFAPLHSPVCRRSALHPGDFLPDEKVTKESPRGGHPLWVLPLGGIIIPPTASPFPPERAATPGSTQATKQLPRHGLTAEGVTLGIAWGEKKTDLPTQLKVANRSGLEAETLSRGLRLAAGGAKRPPRGFQRAQPLARLW